MVTTAVQFFFFFFVWSRRKKVSRRKPRSYYRLVKIAKVKVHQLLEEDGLVRLRLRLVVVVVGGPYLCFIYQERLMVRQFPTLSNATIVTHLVLVVVRYMEVKDVAPIVGP